VGSLDDAGGRSGAAGAGSGADWRSRRSGLRRGSRGAGQRGKAAGLDGPADGADCAGNLTQSGSMSASVAGLADQGADRMTGEQVAVKSPSTAASTPSTPLSVPGCGASPPGTLSIPPRRWPNGVVYVGSGDVYAFGLASGLADPACPNRNSLHPDYNLRQQP
jgi:hypothetical protein